MNRLRFATTCLLSSLAIVSVATFAASTAHAQAAPSDETRKEARDRFDRGLRLFNQGDNAGALAEFMRVQELVPHPLVLYNIGLVQSAMRRPVQAVETFDRLLKDPGTLDAERLAMARQRRDEQAALIGELTVKANVAGASIEVDNVAVGQTPLSQPLRVASGEHLIAVVAAGHLPERRNVAIAGKSAAEVNFQLQPLQGRLAHLIVKTTVPDAEVVVDGQVVGKTPLPASLAFAPGQHTIQLRRPGYTMATQTMMLGEGTTGEVQLEPTIDTASLSSEGGMLALRISEPDSVVFVDGKPQGTYARPLQLPHGRHRIRVERAEFFPFEREVAVEKARGADVAVDLEPTPEKRADYRSNASLVRTLGWIGVGAGGAIAAGSVVFLLWNSGQKDDAKTEFDQAADDLDLYNSGSQGASDPICDPIDGSDSACRERVDIALDDLESARGRDTFGYIGLGVGGAVLATGVVLLLTGNDPDRYEPKEESDVFARSRLLPVGWVHPGGGGASIIGRF